MPYNKSYRGGRRRAPKGSNVRGKRTKYYRVDRGGIRL